MSLSDQLRKMIRDYGSEYAVARDSGVSQATINRFMNGERDLYLATVERLALFFGFEFTKPTTRRAKG